MGPCDVYELDAVEMKDRLCNALIRHKACFNLRPTGRQVGAIAVSMVGWFLLLIYVHPSEIVRLHGCRVDEHSTQGDTGEGRLGRCRLFRASSSQEMIGAGRTMDNLEFALYNYCL
jgi:hypothetical protein